MKTASVIIAVQQILKGAEEFPTKYLLEELSKLKCDVKRIVIIPENAPVINYEIRESVKFSDLIIVVGCITNRTVFKALAKATSQELSRNTEFESALKNLNIITSEDEILLPVNAKILCNHHSELSYPIIYSHRIFVIDYHYFHKTLSINLIAHLQNYFNTPIFSKVIHVPKKICNINIMDKIDKLIESNGVKIDYSENEQYLVFNISSIEFLQVVNYEKKLQCTFGKSTFLTVEDSTIYDKIFQSEEAHIKTALEVIDSCLQNYGLDNIFVSFNGGKDCTVLLHLILAVIRKKFQNGSQPLPCLYVKNENPFPQQDEFISQCQIYYNLEIITIRSGIKEALNEILLEHPNYKACFMGTRRTDPYSSNLDIFQMTDRNWPQIMRVSPLLNWNYDEIWTYLLYYNVPYCPLYDMGYTSLGSTLNTVPNNSLLYYDIFEENETYLPAYKLLDESQERSGRS